MGGAGNGAQLGDIGASIGQLPSPHEVRYPRAVRGLVVIAIAAAGCTFERREGGSADAASDAAVDAVAVCPAGSDWFTIDGSTSKYRIENDSNQVASWWTAHARCTSVGPGIHLVVLDALPEAVSLSLRLPSGRLYYTGMVQANGSNPTTAGWRQLTGAAAIDEWRAGDPNDGKALGNMLDTDEEQFAVIDLATLLRDEDGHRTFYYICECDGRPLDMTLAIPQP